MTNDKRKKEQKKLVGKWIIAGIAIIAVAAIFPLAPFAVNSKGLPYNIGFFGGIGSSGEVSINSNAQNEGRVDLSNDEASSIGDGRRLAMECGCGLHGDDGHTIDYHETVPIIYKEDGTTEQAIVRGGILVLGGTFGDGQASAAQNSTVFVEPSLVLDLRDEMGQLTPPVYERCVCQDVKIMQRQTVNLAYQKESAKVRKSVVVVNEKIDASPIYMTLEEYYSGENKGLEVKCTCPDETDAILSASSNNDEAPKSGLSFEFKTKDSDTLLSEAKPADSVDKNTNTSNARTDQNDSSVMTRGMFLAELARLNNVDAELYTSSIFSDVDFDSQYMPYVVWAAKTQLVTGIGGSLFAPNEPITREQMAVILYNYANVSDIEMPKIKKIKHFKDEDEIHEWAREAVLAMQKAAVMNGNKDRTLEPKGEAKKNEAYAILDRFMEKVVNRENSGA